MSNWQNFYGSCFFWQENTYIHIRISPSCHCTDTHSAPQNNHNSTQQCKKHTFLAHFFVTWYLLFCSHSCRLFVVSKLIGLFVYIFSIDEICVKVFDLVKMRQYLLWLHPIQKILIANRLKDYSGFFVVFCFTLGPHKVLRYVSRQIRIFRI